MEKTLKRLFNGLPETQKKRLSRFHGDESGSMVIFTLFIIVLMLIISGMAVDFMRFESRRAMMQGAVDSAVLAAADLDQALDPQDVVNDYMAKSQAGNCLTNVTVDDSAANYRSVTANCEMVMNTYFLRLIGMDTLTANAASTAIEGVGDIEVAIGVDISGSMGRDTADGGELKIEALRTAAASFVDTLLLPEYEDRISLSLVPYSAHVNVGEDLFGTLNVGARHGWSHCVDIPDGAFDTTAWDAATPLVHTQHVAMNWGTTATICPRFDFEAIIPLSQDATQLKDAIAQLQPRSTTSIFQGVKWGTNLLDPSFNDNIVALPGGVVDDVFRTRPGAYPDLNNPADSDTRKYLVLMTDGRNVGTDRLAPEAYDTPSEIAMWNTVGYNRFANDTTNWRNGDFYRQPYHSTADGNTFMGNICSAAKAEGIIIFGIGLYGEGEDPTGAAAMEACASDGAYFETAGDELTQIFEAIADQITDLRLTL